MANIEIAVPDIGDFEHVDVIDVLVKPGDLVNLEDPLVTLESDKATMDVPAPRGGRVVAVLVKVGDKVSQGKVILSLAEEDSTPQAVAAPASAAAPPQPIAAPPVAPTAAPPATVAASSTQQVLVPDIGDFENVDVIDVLVKVGDIVGLEAPLMTLESDKATMDIPAPAAGRVTKILVAVGAKVSQGAPIVELEVAGEANVAPTPPAKAAAPTTVPIAAPAPTAAVASAPPSKYDFVSPDPGPRSDAPPASSDALLHSGVRIYASPALRKFARELGVDLGVVKGSGRKNRIMKGDVAGFVKQALATKPTAPATGFALPAAPVIDFSKFGATESRPLSKIKRLTGQNLHRAWVTIPHVTQFDEADITELEAFRKSKAAEAEKQGTKLTLVAFLLKAVTAMMQKYPDFNASLSPDGESLIYKQYFNIGMAVNTERGLLVPVIRDVNKKGLYELASEIRALGVKARDGKLSPAEMQGGCFTVSSLGGISGTGFTPIINPPEVAILGISPAAMKPVYKEGIFVPRLMLPCSLSYDHRVIDGVAAAEFTRQLNVILGDIRHLLL